MGEVGGFPNGGAMARAWLEVSHPKAPVSSSKCSTGEAVHIRIR